MSFTSQIQGTTGTRLGLTVEYVEKMWLNIIPLLLFDSVLVTRLRAHLCNFTGRSDELAIKFRSKGRGWASFIMDLWV